MFYPLQLGYFPALHFSYLRNSIMATGTVKWFNDTKGFGFISPIFDSGVNGGVGAVIGLIAAIAFFATIYFFIEVYVRHVGISKRSDGC